jgi:hypothetical protein
MAVKYIFNLFWEGAKTFGLTCCAVTPKDFAPGFFCVTKAAFAFSETLRDFSEHKHRFRHIMAGARTLPMFAGDNFSGRSILTVL